MEDKAKINRARRAAERQGLVLRRSRTRDELALDYGWHVLRGRRELAHLRDLASVEHWLTHPEERNA
jgi:hypothetical protein